MLALIATLTPNRTYISSQLSRGSTCRRIRCRRFSQPGGLWATWYFRFYEVRDVPEMLLIAGKERQFLSWFHNSEAVNARSFTNEVEDVYARAYSTPGALRAGFEYYRAFPEDAKANAEFSKRKLSMPVLGIGGAGSFGPSGHWVAEEQPDAVASALLEFLPPPE
jgi:pimeloyl-ACP methyl ester carboxylesterase